jgi:hypothetical protein
MDNLRLTAEQAELLSRVREPIEIRDASGRVLGVFEPRSTLDASSPVQSLSAYEYAKALGIVGSVADAPADLSTNPRHLEGFGRD